MCLLCFAYLICFSLRSSHKVYINSLRCLIAINRYIAVINIRFADISIMYFLYSFYLFLYCDTFVTLLHLYSFFFAVVRVASLHVPTHPPPSAQVRARPRSWLAVRSLSFRYATLSQSSQLRQRSVVTARRDYLKNK